MATQSDKDNVLNNLHFELHVLRKMPKYKPSNFEIKVSYLISELYSPECLECKQTMEQKKIQIDKQMKGEIPQSSGNFLDKILGK